MSQRTYEIIVKNKSGGEVAKKVGGTGQETVSSGGGQSSAEKAIKSVFKYEVAKSFVMPMIAFEVSTVKLKTGSTEQQQNADFIYNMAGRALNVIETTAMGFMAGNVAGAVVGLVLGVTNQVLDYSRAVERLNIQNSIEKVSRDITAQRATYSGSRYQTVTQE